MFSVDGYNIRLHRGDTGAMKVKANATLNGQTFTFGENDRAVFSIKNGQGDVVKEKYAQMTNNEFIVYFLNADTDTLAPGPGYSWDVRYVINPYYDSDGRIVDGDQVLTPKDPMPMNLLTVVGDI